MKPFASRAHWGSSRRHDTAGVGANGKHDKRALRPARSRRRRGGWATGQVIDHMFLDGLEERLSTRRHEWDSFCRRLRLRDISIHPCRTQMTMQLAVPSRPPLRGANSGAFDGEIAKRL